jgi:predicted PurR-regulated permease PerM
MAQGQMALAQSDTDASDEPSRKRRPQFSLRGLLIVILILAVWLALLRILPHVAIFVLGVTLAAISTVMVITVTRRNTRRRTRVVAWIVAVPCWAIFYLVSVGPAAALRATLPYDGQEILEKMYGPVIWLHDETPLRSPLAEYVEWWEGH